MDRILVTGASGFVGSALVPRLVREGRRVRAASRMQSPPPPGAEAVAVGDIGPGTDWSRALQDIDAVVHLAARVHVGRESPRDGPLFHAVNAAGAGALAPAARAAGVRKFILVSTTTVYGDRSRGQPFDESSPTAPVSAYEGERLVAEALRDSGCTLVILRPPLVYGPGARGNFARLVSWIHSGIPLPLRSVRNKRSLLFVENLADAIVHCLHHPAALGVYTVTDGDDVSTADLIALIAAALERPLRLLPCPLLVLSMAAGLAGRRGAAIRLLCDMVVEGARIRRELGWCAPYSLRSGINAACRDDPAPIAELPESPREAGPRGRIRR